MKNILDNYGVNFNNFKLLCAIEKRKKTNDKICD